MLPSCGSIFAVVAYVAASAGSVVCVEATTKETILLIPFSTSNFLIFFIFRRL